MTDRAPFIVEQGGAPLADHGRYGSADISLVADAGQTFAGLRYEFASIGAVVSGTFAYRSAKGALEAAPGMVLCGDVSEEFSVTGGGDGRVRRAVAAFRADLIEETANALNVAPAFPMSSVLCGRNRVRLYGLLRRLTLTPASHEEQALDALALALGEPACRLAVLNPPGRRRLREVALHLAETCSEPWDLASMADLAGMSRYHFIRSFAAELGETPRQHLVHARLRVAADQLLERREAVTQIALGVGFNDVSHFNHAFRRAFGSSPTRWLGEFSMGPN